MTLLEAVPMLIWLILLVAVAVTVNWLCLEGDTSLDTVLAIPRGTKEGVLRHQPSKLTFSNQRYLHQISINFENRRQFQNLLVLRLLEHTLHLQFKCFLNEIFQVEVQPNFCFRFLSKMNMQ